MLKLNNGEKVYSVKRRHSLLIKLEIAPALSIAFLLLIFVFALPFIPFFRDPQWIFPIYEYTGHFNIIFFICFLVSVCLLLIWKMVFIMISGYHLDCWMITNQRTIHTELHGLFNRYVSSIYHHRIQDVSVDVKGVLSTYLNYGNLQIQTAGKFREFLFKSIPEPYKTKDILMHAQREFLRDKRSNK